jgi:hypothetical protein
MHKKYLLVCAAILMGLSGCGQGDIEKLKAENEALKQEIAKLKETDQSYFGKGVDQLKAANSKDSLQASLDTFTQLVEKFPQSPYLPKAHENISSIKQKIADLEKIETGRQKFSAALSEHHFELASAELRKLKSLIPEDEHKTLSEKLYEEKNKPLETTINKLVSEFGTKNRGWDSSVFKMIDMRVRFDATFTRIDRDRKALDGWLGEELAT